MTEVSGSVETLTIYPLTGARGIPHESVLLGSGGLVGDRMFVLYEPDKDDPAVNARVSQKQCRALAQLVASVEGDDELHVRRDPRLVVAGADAWTLVVPKSAQAEPVSVMEFGDATPCIDMGDEAAERFSRLLGRPVRLGRKTDAWLAGRGHDPAKRANAPVHVVLAETVAYLADKLGPGEDGQRQFGTDRTRAGVVVRGFPALSDAAWVTDGRNGMLYIGDQAALAVDRHTIRCKVPGNDQETGEDLKDVPKTYPHTVRVKAPDDTSSKPGEPTIGVYGHAIGLGPVLIRRGDPVEFVER
ncbi:MAG TPA: MOSC N-terminal beta barrel domain-containing protein [Candidatus Saccharimonadales bacterium]|nr:MOSC N-terminal beta barrel domain-containing protein [Candidatus Saccharimonadales bacterium]